MHHSSGDQMSVIAIEETARNWAAELESRESKRSGVSIRDARKIVARRMSVAPGTLENIRNRRTKGVRAGVFERIRAAFMRELEAEMMRLRHELEMARQCGLDARESEVCAAETELAALHALIEKR